MGDLIKDTADRIAKCNKEEIPKLPNRQEIGNARSYLKQTLELTDADLGMLGPFDVRGEVGVKAHTSPAA